MIVGSEIGDGGIPDRPTGTGVTPTTSKSSGAPSKPPRKTLVLKKETSNMGTLKKFLNQELTRSYLLELEEERFAARREKVYSFIRIPKELERLMAYGFFHCADAFLYIFTFLPLRCVITFYHCFLKVTKNILNAQSNDGRIFRGTLKPADKCDILKILILIFCVYIFTYIDTSVMYHVIKSQSVIKLYIFFNMLEVGDRLFASFVQDTLDALFFTAVEKSETRSHSSLTAHTLLAVGSVLGHAVVLLCQGTTLSVAINANNRALLTVMMSNNFVELKGAVFKKFDKLNLFQVSCSDVRERFHLFILLLMVGIQTMREYGWEESRFWILLPDCVMVLIAEVLVDWIKHAFITRFNELSPDVYQEFTLSLAYDLASSKQRRAISDHSDMLGRRLGFVPLPLAVVLAKTIGPSFPEIGTSTIILLLLSYAALATLRSLYSIILIGKACDLIQNHSNSQQTSTPVPKSGQAANAVIHAHSEVIHTHAHASTSISDENPSFLRFRNTASQPATRSPSPRPMSPSKLNFGSSNEELNALDDEAEFNFSPITKRQPRRSDGKAMYRSVSASHTPRSSLVGLSSTELASLSEAPPLPDSAAGLLMANSAVSILSVGLNEEMVRATTAAAAASSAAVKDSMTGTTHDNAETTGRERHNSRKYSLGSNVENEFSGMATSEPSGATGGDALKPLDKNSQENLHEKSDTELCGCKNSNEHQRECLLLLFAENTDLDSTIVPIIETKEMELNKENDVVDEKEAKVDGNSKKKKKSIVSWFSDLTH